MIKRTLAAAALVALVSGSAWANECPKDMKAIDEAMAKHPMMSGEQMTKVKMLREEGEKLHKAGKHAEAVTTLHQAMDMLGMKKM